LKCGELAPHDGQSYFTKTFGLAYSIVTLNEKFNHAQQVVAELQINTKAYDTLKTPFRKTIGDLERNFSRRLTLSTT